MDVGGSSMPVEQCTMANGSVIRSMARCVLTSNETKQEKTPDESILILYSGSLDFCTKNYIKFAS